MDLLKRGITFPIFCSFFFLLIACNSTSSAKKKQPLPVGTRGDTTAKAQAVVKPENPKLAPLDTNLYKAAVMRLVHDSVSTKWPVKDHFALPGALLPFNRIVAYYGNFYSTHMGVLGEYPPDIMLKKLMDEVKKWQAADSTTPVIPAIHYIAVTGQSQPGKGGKCILRMPFTQIDKALELAKKINAVVFLDVQVGQSTVQAEI